MNMTKMCTAWLLFTVGLLFVPGGIGAEVPAFIDVQQGRPVASSLNWTFVMVGDPSSRFRVYRIGTDRTAIVSTSEYNRGDIAPANANDLARSFIFEDATKGDIVSALDQVIEILKVPTVPNQGNLFDFVCRQPGADGRVVFRIQLKTVPNPNRLVKEPMRSVTIGFGIGAPEFFSKEDVAALRDTLAGLKNGQ